MITQTVRRSDFSKINLKNLETRTYHAAKAICDCLSKARELSLLKHLKLDEHIVDDAPPPVKKSKVNISDVFVCLEVQF